MSIYLVIAGCVVCYFIITLTATIADPLIFYIEDGSLARWIKHVWLHFKKPAWKYRYYLICSVGILAISYSVYGYSSKSLLLSGGIFQAIGTLKAACSIYSTATKIFDKNPIREWIQYFPRIKQKFRPCPPCLAIQESYGVASLRLDMLEDNKNSSIDDRLSIISLNQKMIEKQLIIYAREKKNTGF